MLKDIFPELFKIATDPPNPIWEMSINWGDYDKIDSLINLYESEMESEGGDTARLIQKAEAFVSDIIRLKPQSSEEAELFMYLQFDTCVGLLSFLSKNKLFPDCFDWISNSISETIESSRERELIHDRLAIFEMSRNDFIRNNFPNAFISWSHDVFYYSRCTGGHNELAQFILTRHFSYFIDCVKKRPDEMSVRALSQLATWGINHDFKAQEEITIATLFEIYKESNDKNVKKAVAFFFSAVKRTNTGLSRNEWGKIVLAEYRNSLKAHEYFQLLVSMYESDCALLIQNFDAICSAIREYAKESQNNLSSLRAYHDSRIFSILERTISTLTMNGLVKEINTLFGIYFSIDSSHLIANNLVILPNAEQGVIYSTNGNVLVKDSNVKDNIPEIIQNANRFLGTTHTLNDDIGFVMAKSEREGVPDIDSGPDFFSVLSSHFRLSKLLELPSFNNCLGYYMLFGLQLPIQNILSSELQMTLPIIQSFKKPLTIRPIRHAFIWQGNTQMAEFERKGLEQICSARHISVKWINCFESSKADFIVHYQSPLYDLIWLIGHGEFLHYKSHESYLDLGHDIKVTLKDLKESNIPDDNRRLFVIDVCDATTSALSNGPSAIGISASVINSNQSVIGHAWPITDVAGMTLGFLLASFLVEGLSYEVSHHKTITLFQKGENVIIEHLRSFGLDDEIFDRIRNASIAYDNFYYWGSMNLLI
jgi:hypothetical protein